MALPASDTFIRSNGPIGANWTTTQGTVNISANKALGTGGAENTAYWSADVFGNDHYSEAIYSDGGSGSGTPGVTVRHSGSGGTTQFYLFTTSGASGTAGKVYKVTNGTTYSAAILTTGNISNGNTIRLSVSGTTLSASINGGTAVTATDAGLSTGSAGIYIYSTVGKIAGTFSADNNSTSTAYTLNAAAGSYTATGADDAEQITVGLNSVAGSYSLTGALATFGRAMSGDAGSYGITGADATLSSSVATAYILSIDAGSYSLDGVNFSNITELGLNAAAGSYGVTGTAMGQKQGYVFPALAGSYAVSGNMAYLKGPLDPAFGRTSGGRDRGRSRTR